MDTGSMDYGYNYRYRRKVKFPNTILSDVINLSISLSQYHSFMQFIVTSMEYMVTAIKQKNPHHG